MRSELYIGYLKNEYNFWSFKKSVESWFGWAVASHKTAYYDGLEETTYLMCEAFLQIAINFGFLACYGYEKSLMI